MSGDHARVGGSCSPRLPKRSPNQVDIARKALSEAIGAGADGPRAPAGAADSGGAAADRRPAAAGRRGDAAAAGRSARCRGCRPAATTATSSFLDAAGHRLGCGRSRRPRPGAGDDRPDPGEQPARPARARGARADPAQVPPHRRRRAVRAPGGRRRPARARTGCGWRSPTASSPPATRRARCDRRGHGHRGGRRARSGSWPASRAARRSTRRPKALERGADRFRGRSRAARSAAAPPIGLVQVARYANPQNSSATVLLALLLDGAGPVRRGARRAPDGPADDALDRRRSATSRCAS